MDESGEFQHRNCIYINTKYSGTQNTISVINNSLNGLIAAWTAKNTVSELKDMSRKYPNWIKGSKKQCMAQIDMIRVPEGRERENYILEGKGIVNI